MKKLVIALIVMLWLISGASASEKNVEPKVLKAFKSQFRNAQNVQWTIRENYYMASFACEEKVLFAYYNFESELLGVGRYISTVALPSYLVRNLKNLYPEYWIADLFEVIKDEESVSYYIKLENAAEMIALSSSNGKYWELYFVTLKKG